MNKLNKLIIFALFIVGTVTVAHTGGRLGQGWNMTTSTGTSLVISGGGARLYLKSITLSSSTTNAASEYVVVYTTVPDITINGAGTGLFGGLLFQTTTQILPALMYKTTTTVSGASDNLNNYWSAGNCETCFIEIPGSGGIVLRQPTASSGEALKATVMWGN